MIKYASKLPVSVRVEECKHIPGEPEREQICNKCGKHFDIYDDQEDFRIYRSELGYGTIYDGDELRLNLCCDCLEELVKQCKINPIIERYAE